MVSRVISNFISLTGCDHQSRGEYLHEHEDREHARLGGDNCSQTGGEELTVIMQEIKLMQIYRLAEHMKVAPLESDTMRAKFRVKAQSTVPSPMIYFV